MVLAKLKQVIALLRLPTVGALGLLRLAGGLRIRNLGGLGNRAGEADPVVVAVEDCVELTHKNIADEEHLGLDVELVQARGAELL